MASYDDLRQAIRHITDLTHDPNAWKQGLTPQQVRDVNGWQESSRTGRDYTDPETGATYYHRNVNHGRYPQVPDDAINRIRDQHPTMFDKNTREMVTPPPGAPAPPQPAQAPAPGSGQGAEPQVLTDEQNKGEAAKAVKKLEKDLQDRTDKAVDADRRLAQALLNAHATTAEGARSLNDIQKEIETATNSATALDTPMGAREFQRFLSSKMRQIADVLKTAQLDAQSQREVLAALSEFYSTRQTGTEGQAGGGGGNGGEGGNQQQLPGGLPPDLGLGGGDEFGGLGDDPLLGGGGGDPLQAGLGAASQLIPAAAQIPQNLAGTAAGIPNAIMGGIPGFGGGSGAGGAGGLGDLFGGGKSEHKSKRDREESSSLDDLFNDPGLFPPEENNSPGGDHNGGNNHNGTGGDHNGGNNDKPADQKPGTANANPAGQGMQVPGLTGPTPVTLKDGTTVTAANPELAAVIKDIEKGTPPLEAYRNHNMQISPPTTPPAVPFDIEKLRPGCYGSYSNGDIVVALSPQKIIDMNGQVQPISAAMKAGFLGWQPAPGSTSAVPAAPPFGAANAVANGTTTPAQATK
ncbi:Biofilm regulator BssS [Mycobacteroides abscessus subsp. abscessus]|uniref:DUF4226 domain-containing protein n=1 Tax=Mycobacteroides abscessus TaxID=36809 RepID=UPI0009A5A330|nr:Biofilm regulator BssS [Mycobacteroides abscessus subsp. abscessus]